MLLYPSNAQLLKKVGSRYLLVNVIAQKARKISQRAEDEGYNVDRKPVSMAIEEIDTGMEIDLSKE